MKIKKIYTLIITALLIFGSYASDKESIYDYAMEGIKESYKDYSKSKKYKVDGPYSTRLGKRPEKGETAIYFVLFDDSKSMIEYWDDNGSITIKKINISKKNKDILISKYIGEKKDNFLKDFPLEADKNDHLFDFGGIRYDSEKDLKVIVNVSFENDIITHINFTFRDPSVDYNWD